MTRKVSEFVQREPFIAGATDAHGNAKDSWGPAVEVGIYAFDPGSSSEPREGMARVITAPTMYVPDGAVFDPRDRVTARGKRYEVEGDTEQWRHPDGNRPGNVIPLRRVEG